MSIKKSKLFIFSALVLMLSGMVLADADIEKTDNQNEGIFKIISYWEVGNSGVPCKSSTYNCDLEFNDYKGKDYINNFLYGEEKYNGWNFLNSYKPSFSNKEGYINGVVGKYAKKDDTDPYVALIKTSTSDEISIMYTLVYVKEEIDSLKLVGKASGSRRETARVKAILEIFDLTSGEDTTKDEVNLANINFEEPKYTLEIDKIKTDDGWSKGDEDELSEGQFLKPGLYLFLLKHRHHASSGLDRAEQTKSIVYLDEKFIETNSEKYSIFYSLEEYNSCSDSDESSFCCFLDTGSNQNYLAGLNETFRCCGDNNTPIGTQFKLNGNNFYCKVNGWEEISANETCSDKGGVYSSSIGKDNITAIYNVFDATDGCCGDDAYGYVKEDSCKGNADLSCLDVDINDCENSGCSLNLKCSELSYSECNGACKLEEVKGNIATFDDSIKEYSMSKNKSICLRDDSIYSYWVYTITSEQECINQDDKNFDYWWFNPNDISEYCYYNLFQFFRDTKDRCEDYGYNWIEMPSCQNKNKYSCTDETCQCVGNTEIKCSDFNYNKCPSKCDKIPANSTGDLGALAKNGSSLCYQEDNGDWQWKHAGEIGSDFGKIYRMFEDDDTLNTESVITNEEQWFVCDATTTSTLFSFKDYGVTKIFDSQGHDTNKTYTLNLSEFDIPYEGKNDLKINELACSDVLSSVLGVTFEDLDTDYVITDEKNYCIKGNDGIKRFRIYIPNAFENECQECSYNGTKLQNNDFSSKICDLKEFKETQWCTNNSFTQQLKLKSDCLFDTSKCMNITIDSVESCTQEGMDGNFKFFTNCNEGICKNGALVNSDDNGKCCVGNSQPVECINKDALTSKSDCTKLGGEVTEIDKCSPSYLNFQIEDTDDYCCFGYVIPDISEWSHVSEEKFICYDDGNNNYFAECCFNDNCVNPEEKEGNNNIYPNYRVEGGSLHQITNFDHYNEEIKKANDYIFQRPNILDLTQSNYLTKSDWSNFETLEFEVSSNNINNWDVSLYSNNHKRPIGKLSNFTITGNESYRWHKVIIILPIKSTSGDKINYSKITGMNIVSSNQYDQILIDDLYLGNLRRLD